MARNENVKVELKKGIAQFNLVGKFKKNDFTFDLDKHSDKSDWVYNKLNLGVDCGGGNIIHAEMMGGYGEERNNFLHVHGCKNVDGKITDDWSNTYKIDWDDRFNESLLEELGDGCFLKIGILKDKDGKTVVHKFLSCLLYTSPSPRDKRQSRMPSSA